MKRCPECRRDYYDETLLYCLDDGTALLDGPGKSELAGSSAETSSPDHESATAIFHATDAPGEQKTAAQIHTTQRTEVLPGGHPSHTYNVRRFNPAWIVAAVLLIGGIAGYFGYR